MGNADEHSVAIFLVWGNEFYNRLLTIRGFYNFEIVRAEKSWECFYDGFFCSEARGNEGDRVRCVVECFDLARQQKIFRKAPQVTDLFYPREFYDVGADAYHALIVNM